MARDAIEPIAHGGDLCVARRRFPSAPEPWIDLSAGINPHAYPLPELSSEVWQRLPQAEAEQRLLHAAAQRYGADAECIVAAPGTQALIQFVPRLLPPTDVAVLTTTYAEHAAAWERCEHRVTEREGLADIGAARVVVAVNPNNPTGRLLPRDDLARAAGEMKRRGGLLVVDEAFIDFEPTGASVAAQLPPSTVVLRSFGKAYGLAGLRLGFAIASPAIARRLRVELGPWSVSGPALAIGAAALADMRWLNEMSNKLSNDCRRLDALLLGAGFSIEGGTLLFRLTQHSHAAEIADALGRGGIHVRRFAAHPSWLRFGLPAAEPEWARLAASLSAAPV